MAKLTKKQKEAFAKFDKNNVYSLEEAISVVKQITYTKFDSSFDIDVRLGVDPRKANQMVRGSVTLPHGTGKTVRVLVLCTPDKEEEAKAAGADYYGLDEYITKIKGGWTDVDVIITMPSVMPKIGALGRILGPRGLMPNPKTGTVTMEVGKAVKEAKAGKIDFKVDKFGRKMQLRQREAHGEHPRGAPGHHQAETLRRQGHIREEHHRLLHHEPRSQGRHQSRHIVIN